MSDLDKNTNPFDDPDFMAFMMSMKQMSEDRMMEMSYDLLVRNSESALLHDAPIESKLQAIEKVINYFEKSEEYEKCAKLQELKLRITKKGI